MSLSDLLSILIGIVVFYGAFLISELHQLRKSTQGLQETLGEILGTTQELQDVAEAISRKQAPSQSDKK